MFGGGDHQASGDNTSNSNLVKVKSEPFEYSNIANSNSNSRPSFGLQTGADSSSSCSNSNSKLNSVNTSSKDSGNQVSILKRPILTPCDIEDIIDEEATRQQLLYDYSSMDAW
jgi:hypothetical protein